MSFFTALPLEIRGLIYEELITVAPQGTTGYKRHSMAVITSCTIPIFLLLISRVFSNELLCMLSLVRDVHVEAGSVYDPIDDLITLWPREVARRSRRLSVHFSNALDVGYRMHWKHQYIPHSSRSTLEKVLFLINESSTCTANRLAITLDLPEVEPARTLLQKITSIADSKVEVVRYRDRWNGFLCEKIAFVRERGSGRQLDVNVLVRSRT
jgi:hypothetical protein